MFNILIFLILCLIVNIIVIAIVWNLYADKIQLLIAKKGEKDQILGTFLLSYQTFNCHSLELTISSISKEQLRFESFDLKLPKDYTPRI
jgi:hypothetical protein